MDPTAPSWDVVVVGAGPAGSTAARTAAASGARTLLIDRSAFPRYKTCGGGLLGVSRSLLPPAAEATVEAEVSRVVFTLRGRAPVVLTRDAPFLAMTRRESLDAALAQAAVEAGAEFRPGVALRSLRETDAGVVVGTTAGTLSALAVVGADGAGGRVGRYVGVTPARVDLGLEEERVVPAGAPDRDLVRIDWGPGAGSYAWTFPKRRMDTVGVIEPRGNAVRTRAYLGAWASAQPAPEAEVERSSGHLTQWREPGSPLRRGPILAAGDAAGLLEPWTREGISFALRSGAFAGAAAARFARSGDPLDLDAYAHDVARELEPEMRAGELLLTLFERRPAWVHGMLRRSRRARAFFVGFCAGTRSLAELDAHPWLHRAVRVLS